MEILIPKKNVILDSQVLTTLMACPRLTDFRFNHSFQGIKGKPKSLEMGSLVHTALEAYYKAIVNKHKRTDAIGFAMSAALGYEVRNTSDEDRKWALQTCEDYFEFWSNDHWVPLEVEVVKGELLYEDDEIRILYKAKFDLIVDTNQGIHAVDHKTMAQRRDTLNLNNQFTGQCILTGTRQMFVNKIGFQRTLKPHERFTRDSVSYSADRIDEWRNTILPYYAKLMIQYEENQYWPPNFTHCENKYGICQFKEVCESNRNMREEEIQNNFVVGDKWDISNLEKDNA
jgi:hypothetical protein